MCLCLVFARVHVFAHGRSECLCVFALIYTCVCAQSRNCVSKCVVRGHTVYVCQSYSVYVRISVQLGHIFASLVYV